MPTPRRKSAKSKHTKRPNVAEIPWVEIPILIHGIMPDKIPGTCKREYDNLLHGVNNALKMTPRAGFSNFSLEVPVIWGRPISNAGPHEPDEYLSEVERKLEVHAKQAMGPAYDRLFGIFGALHDFIFYGVSDLVYYVSGDGETSIRNRVFGYIAREIAKRDRELRGRFSLTIFGHSAGSLIAHDLLYHLFSVSGPESEEATLHRDMQKLRKLVSEGRLRARRLYTFGSPITPMVLRANSLLKIFHEDRLLDPEDLGLINGQDDLSNPRWVNFWTRNDAASYPVEFMYENTAGIVKDVEISSPFNPVTAHSSYWRSTEMADHIAQTL